MSKFYIKSLMAIAICLFAGTATIAQSLEVSVGGIFNGIGGIWRDGVVEEISNTDQIYFIVKDGDDEYVAGRTLDMVPIVWKNGEELYRLDEGEYNDRSVSSMAVRDGNVYVTTIDLTTTWQNDAMVWINGEISEDYADAVEINGIFLDGEDVYVAGRTFDQAVIWKNAEPLYTYFSEGTGLFCDVVVADGDVYYLGGDFGGGAGKSAALKSQGEVPVHTNHTRDFGVKAWKNGEELYFLSEELYGGRMTLSNGKVYVSGQAASGMIYRAYLWTDDEPTPLSDEWSGTGTMCICGDDVYVTGFKGNYPELDAYIWKNGELETIATGGYNYGNCIVVVPLGASVEEPQESYSVCPNPANNSISIEGVEFEEAALYNAMGQLVLTSRENRIDVSGLASGLYLLKLDGTSARNIIIRH